MLNKLIHSLLPALGRNALKLSIFSIVLAFSFSAFAQEEAAPAVSGEVAYILNTFLFLVCGFLVMFMAAGFCMLEAGQVRSKNTAVICLKNIGLFSIAGIMYYLIGYNLMYDGVDGGYFGSFSLPTPGEVASFGAPVGLLTCRGDQASAVRGEVLRMRLRLMPSGVRLPLCSGTRFGGP